MVDKDVKELFKYLMEEMSGLVSVATKIGDNHRLTTKERDNLVLELEKLRKEYSRLSSEFGRLSSEGEAYKKDRRRIPPLERIEEIVRLEDIIQERIRKGEKLQFGDRDVVALHRLYEQYRQVISLKEFIDSFRQQIVDYRRLEEQVESLGEKISAAREDLSERYLPP